MKKILFIHSSAELYGSDKSLLNIVNNMDYEEFEVHIILPCEGPLVNKLKENKNVKVNIYDVAILRRKNLSFKGLIKYIKQFVKSYRNIKKYVKNNDIDIIYTNTSVVFPGAIVAKRMGIKSVWHIREIVKNNFENKVISHIVNHYSDIVITNSKATADAIKVDKEKVRIVYNAVESPKINKNQIRKENNKFVIGMAGRINRWKGQSLFINAAEKVLEKYPDTLFLIAGSAYTGEEYLEEELKEIIAHKKLEKSIKLLGQVSKMETFYEKIDLFVLPSIQPEPFGLVVIEAMDAGIPVIATNQGGPKEIISDGKNGYLVDFKDANEMAEKIMLLESDLELRKRIAENAKKTKKEKFSVEIMAKNIREILNEI